MKKLFNAHVLMATNLDWTKWLRFEEYTVIAHSKEEAEQKLEAHYKNMFRRYETIKVFEPHERDVRYERITRILRDDPS